jgi:hypothetical protein
MIGIMRPTKRGKLTFFEEKRKLFRRQQWEIVSPAFTLW